MRGLLVDRVLRMLDVDPPQWRVLVLTALRVDLRTAGAMSLSRLGGGSGARSLTGFVASLVFVSLVLAAFVLIARDLFFSLTILYSFVIFSIGSSLLMEFHAIVLSPHDHRQLAYQPVSSRTFFAARITAVFAYVGLMTVSLGILPLIACVFTRAGGGLAVALAVLAGLIVAAVTTTFFAIGAYIVLLHYVPTAGLKRALTYLQLVATFLVYGSYFLVPRLLGEGALDALTIERRGWVLAMPSTWYASYADLAAGRATSVQVGLVIVSWIVCALSVRLTAGRLSLDYADRLGLLAGETAQTTATARRPLRRGWIFRDGEHRAIALLVRGLYRHDLRFRLGVLGIVPLTVIYLFAGAGPGGVTDPFVAAPDGRPQLVYYAVLFFPSMLRQALSKSDAYRAAWILHSAPADSARLVLGMKDIVLLMFVVPYLGFVGLLIAWSFERLDHLAALLLVLALLTHLIVVIELWVNPQLPFSQPATRGSRTRDMLLLIGVVSALAPFLPRLLHVAFATPGRLAGTFAALVLVNLLLLQAATRRVRRLANAAEFQL